VNATGSITVTPDTSQKTLTVTAQAASKVYGAADPALSYVITGFEGTDDEDDLDTGVSISRVSGEDVGAYLITPSGASDANYTVNFVTSTFTITPAILTITAEDKSKSYDSENPELTASYSGFVNSEDASDLDTPVSLGTTAVFSSPAGTYPITADSASSTNYNIIFEEGTLTVVPKVDFKPILYSSNTNVLGSEGVIDFRILIGEYAGTDSDGSADVEFRIAKKSELAITFNPSLKVLNGQPVNNSDWVYDGSHPFLHKFIYVGNNGIFLANTGKFIGINAILKPSANTKGLFPLKITVKSGSGGETITINNNDLDYINYDNSED
jgi:hypothetical protein